MKNHRKERAQAREKAKKLVAQMTLMEKAAQLRYDAAPVERLGVPTTITGMRLCTVWQERE